MTGSDIQVERVTALPVEELAGLVAASEAEGFGFLRRLREEWTTARERFDRPGEAFFTARIQGRLTGVCGLSRDPYTGRSDVGRVRRLYVLPAFRGQGVGRRLVEAVLEVARPHFTLLSLRTDNPVAARFYEGLGFDPSPGLECTTHLKALELPDPRASVASLPVRTRIPPPAADPPARGCSHSLERPSMPDLHPKDPLHGITLENLLTQLVARHGWEELGRRLDFRCFQEDPSMKSCLTFLRRAPWARKQVEALFLRGPKG